ncbi:alcohol oxidase [Stereum hirsutum FP-91666 SS1]|uniref:alcohol oxidase n=1 Tax=Stereum hirsutum (strain FP-91666) TaxID=721885 RepID=UPI000440EB04|nr:alcohol oxidase [Stereum hirsutum FP-91666 SS1]EIM87118.1 alcohol oxidase [Stereum hirsutum FP-91666 SS1]
MAEKNSPDSSYDIVVAGGGTSGCLIAGRLAAAHPTLKILVLEAGPTTRDDPKHVRPGQYIRHLWPTSNTVRYHVGHTSEALGGRAPLVPCGQCLGGGSSVNFMMYTRASASDYDDWEQLYDNPGWGSKDLLPLLEKVETYQANPGAETHGTSGPLNVSRGGIYSNVGKQFLDVAKYMDPGRMLDEDADTNNLKKLNVYCRWNKWIDGVSGKRSDVPHHFIYNQSDNPNLHIVTGVHVKRVLFDEDRRPNTVEFQYNTAIRPDADSSQVHKVNATKQVVISAGAFGSPGILERSGIGAKEVLKENGVKAAFGSDFELAGVGENYRDHHLMFWPYNAAPEAETLDAIIRGEPDKVEEALKSWTEQGKGVFASNGIDSGIKFRPTERELEQIGPEFKERWNDHFADAPDKPAFLLVPTSLNFADPTLLPARNFYCMAFYSAYPMSIGHVHITSATDPAAPLDFRSGFLDDKADVQILSFAYKFSRELARRMPLFRGEVTAMHPKFPPGSKAAAIEDCEAALPLVFRGGENGHAGGDAEKEKGEWERIVYDEKDEEAVDAAVREYASTTWHSMGTCAMKPRSQNGVVDPRLNVYGTKGLKVADMSIAPSNVSSNTYTTALTIAEKAFLIIEEDLGLNKA